jgi:uncharacterized membrane protein
MTFPEVLNLIRTFISSIGVATIVVSAIRSVFLFVLHLRGIREIDINHIRLQFGDGIILGLEFMVGADIIESIVKPNYYDVGLLGLLVVIRTFLSYFINRELKDVWREEKKCHKDV